MHLDSVRELKDDFLEPAAAEDLAPMPVGARPFGRTPARHRTIALGIAGRGPDYRLAVRVQRPALLHSPLVERIVSAARGEADVRVIGRVDKRTRRRRATGRAAGAEVWHRKRLRPLLIGASVGHVMVTAGTLGAFVRRAGRAGILSNNHVLANEDDAKTGDAILQPGRYDAGRNPADRVGSLKWWVRLKVKAANRVDAAVAILNDDIEYDTTRLRALVDGKACTLAGLGPDSVDTGTTVHKVGRTTGPTTGRVTAFDVDNLVIRYDAGNLRFDGQVEIEGTGKQTFSDGGDSGSMIVDADFGAVALLFAGSDAGGDNGLGLTYANPIHLALKELKAELML